MLDSACIEWPSLSYGFAPERIESSILDFASWHVLPFEMRLNKRVNNGGSSSVGRLIDCVSVLFVCEFDLKLVIRGSLWELYRIRYSLT